MHRSGEGVWSVDLASDGEKLADCHRLTGPDCVVQDLGVKVAWGEEVVFDRLRSAVGEVALYVVFQRRDGPGLDQVRAEREVWHE